MTDEAAFQQALQATPGDMSLRLVFADFLEERGDPRAELLRLTHTLTQSVEVPHRTDLEARLRGLLEHGVQPIGPFWTNSLGMKFAWIPAGTFLMGSPEDEPQRGNHERQHKVTLSQGYYMGVFTVTQGEWQAVMGNNPSLFKNEKNLPVEAVSWEDSQEFVKILRENEKSPYRLPTEAEWEYACRAGTTTPFYFGVTLPSELANYNGNDTYGTGTKGKYRETTTPVGSFPANAFGLFDMHGNVFEWCQDWYGDYQSNDDFDPLGQNTGEFRVLRGGSWNNGPLGCRSAYRDGGKPGYRLNSDGLRVCFCLD